MRNDPVSAILPKLRILLCVNEELMAKILTLSISFVYFFTLHVLQIDAYR